MKDPFQTLGLQSGASEDEIKKAYKDLAKKWHPDINKAPEAEEKFKEVSQAYEVLKNNNWTAPMTGGFPGFGDMFNMHGDIFSHIDLNDFINGTRSKRRFIKKAQLAITFEEAFCGCKKTIQISNKKQCTVCGGKGIILKNDMCKTCGGSGQVRTGKGVVHFISTCNHCRGFGREVENKCSSCNGQGQVNETEILDIQIPLKTPHGTIIKPKQDVDVHIYIQKHSEFHLIDECNIGSKADVDVFLAILGGNINVNTLSGVKKMKIAEGTQPNTVLRIKDGGLGGDHLIEINIKIPTVNNVQRELLEKIRDKEGLNE
jgi:molecular chaperone DnaJ